VRLDDGLRTSASTPSRSASVVANAGALARCAHEGGGRIAQVIGVDGARLADADGELGRPDGTTKVCPACPRTLGGQRRDRPRERGTAPLVATGRPTASTCLGTVRVIWTVAVMSDILPGPTPMCSLRLQ
jgi:hypothetical protein